MNISKHRDPEADMPKNRESSPSHWLFSPELDQLLADKMFDGQSGSHRLELINLLSQRTYPEELPRLKARLLEVITADDANAYDQWVARMFLVPNDVMFKTHIRWGEDLAAAIMSDATPSTTALEFVGEYYRMSMAKALPGPRWGDYTSQRLDAKARGEAIEEMKKLSDLEKTRLAKSVKDLSSLNANAKRVVEVSARYAITSHAAFVLSLEPDLARAIKGADAAARLRALYVVSMTEPGFVPMVDEVLASADFKPANEIERNLVQMRKRP
jgi:hypothetical protein